MTQDQESHEDQRSVKLVADALEEDRRATCEEFSRATGVPGMSIFRISTNDLKKKIISARWVPHCLTAEQKQKRLGIATLLKERFNVEDHAFWVELSLLMKRRLGTLSRN